MRRVTYWTRNDPELPDFSESEDEDDEESDEEIDIPEGNVKNNIENISHVCFPTARLELSKRDVFPNSSKGLVTNYREGEGLQNGRGGGACEVITLRKGGGRKLFKPC